MVKGKAKLQGKKQAAQKKVAAKKTKGEKNLQSIIKKQKVTKSKNTIVEPVEDASEDNAIEENDNSSNSESENEECFQSFDIMASEENESDQAEQSETAGDSSNVAENETFSEDTPNISGKSGHVDTTDSYSQPPATTRVFINNLAMGTSSNSLTNFFTSKDLELVDLFIPKGPNGHKGYAFAEFKSVEESTNAVGLSGSNLDGSQIGITFAKPRRDAGHGGQESNRSDSNILFIKNLPHNTTKESLMECFDEAMDIRVMTNPDGSCKGHAYMDFQSGDAAKRIKETKNHSVVLGNRVELDFAQPRGQSFKRGGQNNFRHGGSNNMRGGWGNRRGDSGRGNYSQSRPNERYFNHRGGNQGYRGGDRSQRGGFNRPRGNKIRFNMDD